jgi:hypothetical protein
MSQLVAPLDPDSEKGREVAERLTQIFAEVRLAIAEREATAARQEPTEPGERAA